METKSIFLSRTFYAAVLSLIGAGLHLFGVEFPESEQASLTDQIMGAIPYVLEVVGFIGVLWGRITARQVVTVMGGTVPPAGALLNNVPR